jgi:hypothetical protein
MIDDDECGAVGEMRIGKGNRSTRRKPTPVTLCPPQIPHDMDWAVSTDVLIREDTGHQEASGNVSLEGKLVSTRTKPSSKDNLL